MKILTWEGSIGEGVYILHSSSWRKGRVGEILKCPGACVRINAINSYWCALNFISPSVLQKLVTTLNVHFETHVTGLRLDGTAGSCDGLGDALPITIKILRVGGFLGQCLKILGFSWKGGFQIDLSFFFSSKKKKTLLFSYLFLTSHHPHPSSQKKKILFSLTYSLWKIIHWGRSSWP